MRRPSATRAFGTRVSEILAGRMPFGDLDLVEDELQVGAEEMHARADDAGLRSIEQRRRPGAGAPAATAAVGAENTVSSTPLAS